MIYFNAKYVMIGYVMIVKLTLINLLRLTTTVASHAQNTYNN